MAERYLFPVSLPALPAAMSRRGTAFGRFVGCAILKVLGWRVEGSFPDTPKFILIGAPHTSNWDAIVGLAAILRLNLDIRFYAKKQAFGPPTGWLLKRLGGIPVDRSAAHGLVGGAIRDFNNHETFFLGITPEGTRQRRKGWKTGFHVIGRAAGVPVVLIGLDFGRRVIGPLATIDLTEDLDHDLAEIGKHFEGIRGRNPELYTPPV